MCHCILWQCFIEAPFVLALVITIGSIKSKPHIPRGIKFKNLHEDFPKKVNKVFTNQPLDQGGGDSNPLGLPKLLKYFGLPMVHLGRPPLPISRPYCWPLKYLEYIKDSDPNAHVRVFKATIKANNEINDVEIVNLFNFTFRNIVFHYCNNYLGDYPDYTFAKLQLTFCKRYRKVQNDEQVCLHL